MGQSKTAPTYSLKIGRHSSIFHGAMKISRPELMHRVEQGLKTSPVTALLGPRQSGKTTLARKVAGKATTETHQWRMIGSYKRGDQQGG